MEKLNSKKYRRYSLKVFGPVAFAFILPSLSYAIDASPQAFTYQGYLTDAGGNPLSGTQTLLLKLYDPSGTCLLYEESQTFDVTATLGLFSIQVGSQLGDSKRVAAVDPGISMATVFSNSSSLAIVPQSPSCTLLGGYTPSAGDGRYLRLVVNGTTLSPDQSMGSLPQALVAQSLQGQTPANFVQITGNSSPYSIGQSNWNLLFGTGGGGAPGSNPVNASTLHLHDDRYVQIGSSTSQNLGSGGLYSAGTAGVGMSTLPPGTQFEVKNNTASAVGVIIKGASSQAADLFEVQNSLGTVLDKIDSSGNLWIGGNQVATQTYINGNYLPLGGGTLTGTLSGTSFTSSSQNGLVLSPYGTSAGHTGEIRFQELASNGVNYVAFKSSDSVSNSQIWVLPAADGSTGQVLKTDGAGNLSWISASTGSVTGVTASSPLTSSGGATPQISLPAATSSANGYLASGDWSTFNGKVGGASNLTAAGGLVQVSSSGVITQTTGITASTTANISSLTIAGGSAQTTTPELQVNDDVSNSLFTMVKSGLMTLFNQKAATGVSEFVVKAGAGQSTTPLQQWQNNTGSPLYSINSSGSATNSFDVANKGDIASILTASLASYLPLSGGTLTGPLSGTSLSTSGNITDAGTLAVTGSSTLAAISATGTATFKGTTSDNTAAALSVTNAANSSSLYVRNDGYVGIGNTNPAARLEIDGASGSTLKIVDTNQALGKVLTSDANGVASWQVVPTSMVYPVSGIPNSSGSAWGTSYSTSGSGSVIALTNSPTFTTPTLGAASATTVNGLSLTSNATGLSLAGGTASKTLTVSNSLTLAGTDSSTLNIGGGGTLGSAAYTAATAYAPASTVSSQWTTSGQYLYYNGTSNVGIGTTTPSTAGLQVSSSGAASFSGEKLDGTWYSAGTSTTNKPQLLIEPASTTSTGWSTSGTGVGINASSGFSGNLIDAQVNGVSNFNVSSAGVVTGSSFAGSGASLTNIPNSAVTTSGHNVSAPLSCTDSSGSGTAQACNTSPSFTPAANDCIIYSTSTANTGTGLTLNVNSLGAKSIGKWQGVTNLAANDVSANKPVIACYDGSKWNLSTIGNPIAPNFTLMLGNFSSYPASAQGGWTAAGTTYYISLPSFHPSSTGFGVSLPEAAVLRQVEFRSWAFTPSSGLAATVSIYDETTGASLAGTNSTALTFSTSTGGFGYGERVVLGNLSDAIASGHQLSIKLVTPAWGTLPTNVTITAILYFH